MAGRYVSEIEIKTNVEKALKQILELQKKTDNLENKEYKIDIGVDSQKFEKVIGSLEKMLDSLGKGTGDFKQFENLSKELSDVISEVQSLSKAFGKVDDSGTKTLLSSIQSIDKSLSDLSQHITGVNTDFGSIGKNASDNVGQINEAKKATEGLTDATKDLAKAQKNLNGNKSNISSGNSNQSSTAKSFEKVSENAKKANEAAKEFVFKPNTEGFNDVIEKFNIVKELAQQITKITKTTANDSTISYNAKLKNGSNYYLGESSNPQVLKANEVVYDAKAINSAYEEATKINNALNETDSTIKNLTVPQSLKEEFEYLLKQITELQTKLKSGEISVPNYNKLTGSLISNYSIEEKKTQADVNSALKKQESAWKNIQSIREKIATANPNDTEYISSLKNAKKYYQEQYLEAQKVLKANQDLYNVETQRNRLRQITLETDARITNSQNVEQNKKAYQELNSVIRQYSEVSKKIANGKALDGDIALADELKRKISELQNSPILSPSQIEESKEKLSKLAKELDILKGKTNSNYVSGIDESIKKYQESLRKFSVVPETDHRFSSWQTQLDQLETKIVELQNLKRNISYDANGVVNQNDINSINQVTLEIDELILKMKDVPNAMRGWNSLSASKTAEKINDLLKNNTRMSEDARLRIKAYYDEIKNGNPSAPLNEILDTCIHIVQQERAMGRAGKSFFDIFKTKAFYGLISQMQSYLSMYVGFYGMMRYIRSAIKTITELDTALIDLKKTTSMTGSQLEDFYYDSNKVAKQMGVTTKEIIDQASAWSRLGYSTQEASTKMAELSSQFASISPGMEVDDAQSGLVSIMKAKFYALIYSNVYLEYI